MRKSVVTALLAFVFSFGITGRVNAQITTIRIVSAAIDTIHDDDTVYLSAFVHNTGGSTINIQGYNASYRGLLLDTLHFVQMSGADSIRPNDSIFVDFFIANPVGSPIPNISPGGGAVVVWPVYSPGFVIDTGRMTLYYLGPSDVDDNGFPKVRLLYNSERLDILFFEVMDLNVQLFDMQGRQLIQQRDISSQASLHIADLPSGVYIVTLRAGQKSKSIKFVKY